MWPFTPKPPQPDTSPKPAPRGRVGDTAVAKPKATVEVRVYRAKEDKWYDLEELRKTEQG